MIKRTPRSLLIQSWITALANTCGTNNIEDPRLLAAAITAAGYEFATSHLRIPEERDEQFQSQIGG